MVAGCKARAIVGSTKGEQRAASGMHGMRVSEARGRSYEIIKPMKMKMLMRAKAPAPLKPTRKMTKSVIEETPIRRSRSSDTVKGLLSLSSALRQSVCA